MRPLLDVRDLHVSFEGPTGTVHALRGVDLQVAPGETVALVGESGCGKSVTARAILNMVPPPGRITRGSVLYHREPWEAVDGAPTDLAALSPTGRLIRSVRWREIAMIFQEPMASLSPVHTVGRQIGEPMVLHLGLSRSEARRRAIELLGLVGIPDPELRVDGYPFQLSGGMRQRAMIAMALACEPRLLIADEPTTALDVTIQAQILQLLRSLQERFGMAILLISHNLGVVASIAHRVAVMYLGVVVETGPAERVFDAPKHPYTKALLRSVPRIGERRGGRLWSIAGTVPDPQTEVRGCAFHSRCPEVIPGVCDVERPPQVSFDDSHFGLCHLYGAQAKTGTQATERAREADRD